MNHGLELNPPRLFDFQINGFGGVDFQQDDLTVSQLRCACAALRRHGTSQIFLTLITDHPDRLCRRLEQLEKFCIAEPTLREMIAGYHLEGPWLSPEPGYCGAHLAAYMCAPDLRVFARLQSAAQGRVKLVTLAPEWPDSDEFIGEISRRGVHVALGHTQASENEIDAAIRAGARFCTHLGNAVPMWLPRHDNVVQRLLARDELTACFIPDGLHLPPFLLKNFVRAKPAGKVLFTTDAMAAAGAGPGRYTLAHHVIEVGGDGVARMPDGKGFAGSTLTPDQGVENLVNLLGLPRDEAEFSWSTAGAEAFGVKAVETRS